MERDYWEGAGKASEVLRGRGGKGIFGGRGRESEVFEGQKKEGLLG